MSNRSIRSQFVIYLKRALLVIAFVFIFPIILAIILPLLNHSVALWFAIVMAGVSAFVFIKPLSLPLLRSRWFALGFLWLALFGSLLVISMPTETIEKQDKAEFTELKTNDADASLAKLKDKGQDLDQAQMDRRKRAIHKDKRLHELYEAEKKKRLTAKEAENSKEQITKRYAVNTPDGVQAKSQDKGGSSKGGSSDQASKVDSMSAVEQMELAFVGNPMQSEIRVLIDPVMKMYGVALSEDGYSRAGSVLVILRKNTGVSETEILRCMKAANLGGRTKFPDIAALCATTLTK